MILLILFAFIAGIVTILSPCILPILPLILSGSVGAGKKKPFGIVLGFITSFTFFTLFLSTIVKITNIPAESLRIFSIFIIFIFGFTLVIPKLQKKIELIFTSLSSRAPKTQNNQGLWGGFMIGISLGLIWTPCVGPILAAVISLTFIGDINLSSIFITLSYSLGTAIPMFAIIYGGKKIITKNQWLLRNTANIQKSFGVVMIITAIAIVFNFDRKFQTYILEIFPNYGSGLTKIEENNQVKLQIDKLISTDANKEDATNKTKPKQNLGKAPELIQGGQWFNSQPLTLEKLRGKVVLVDFWTYSCINCIRTLPHIQSWQEKYSDQGLVIIGVHAPEFEFEKNSDNVAKAVQNFGLTYPVMQDNDFATWRAYNNRYWPAKYLIDKDGIIRYTHFGEGGYSESEDMIRQLLKESGEQIKPQVNDIKTEKQNSFYKKTPETYLGYKRIDNFISNEQLVIDKFSNYSSPSVIPVDSFSFHGEWLVTGEYSQPKPGASLDLNFQGKKVFLVMNPSSDPVPIIITLNEGAQNQTETTIQIDKDQLYQLIEQTQPGSHLLKITFPQGGVEVYAFTFG